MKKSLFILSSLLLLHIAPLMEVVAQGSEQAVEQEESIEKKSEKKKKDEKQDPYDPDTYKTVFEPDQYKIGKDMPAGLYKVYKIDKYASFSVTGDARGEERIAYQSVESFAYIEVEEDQYLKLDGCFAVPEEEMLPFDAENEEVYGPGIYKVGFDIEPGEYKAMASGKYPRYHIYEDALMTEYVTSSSIKKSAYIEVKEDEFLSLVDAEIMIDR